MSLYSDVIDAALAAVQGIALLQTDGVTVTFWPKPEWNSGTQTARQVLVCPEEDLAEKVAADPTAEAYGRAVDLVFSVYVGVITLRQVDQDFAYQRMGWREAIRLVLWSLVLAKAAGGFGVEYDPKGTGAKLTAGDNADETWMRFDFYVSTVRTNDVNG